MESYVAGCSVYLVRSGLGAPPQKTPAWDAGALLLSKVAAEKACLLLDLEQ